MTDFVDEINKRMQDFARKQDEFVLQNLSFENLLELHKMVCAEICKRSDETAKEAWKDANTYTTKQFEIKEAE